MSLGASATAQDPIGNPTNPVELNADLTFTPYRPFAVGEAQDSAPAELTDIYTPRRGVLDSEALDAPLDTVMEWSRSLEEKTGLRIGAAYTVIFQQASGGPGRRYGAAGDFDIMTAWTLLGRGTRDTGTFFFTGENRHEIGPQSAFDLGPEIGTLQRTTNGFNDRGWVVRDAYWIQRLFEDRFRFLLGRADPGDFFGAHRMHNKNASFSNRAFSASTTVAGPGHGMTAGVSLQPIPEFFVTSGVSNAWGRTTVNDMSRLDEAEFFSFVEAGFTPTIDTMGLGRYRLLLWHADSREDAGAPGDAGFQITIDQELGDVLLLFARYGNSDDGTTGIQTSFDGGVGFRGLLGDPNNLGGVGFAYSVPTGPGRDEKTIEVFHRWQLTSYTQFSVGAQAIFDPTNAPDSDVIGVFTVRFRIAF